MDRAATKGVYPSFLIIFVLLFSALGCSVAHIPKDMGESDSSDVQLYKVHDIVAKGGISIGGEDCLQHRNSQD